MSIQNVATRRRFLVKHLTHYHYSQAIQRSQHCLHLRPIHDLHQNVSDYRLTIAPAVPVIEHEDVFGNWTTRFEITQPYTDLTIESNAVVELFDVDPFSFAN